MNIKNTINKKAARKKAILEGAAYLFAENDFHDVKMDDIASQIGISKGTLYLYYKNKDDLFLSIIKEGINRLQKILEQAISTDEDFVSVLKILVHDFLYFFEMHTPFFKILQSDLNKMSLESHREMHLAAEQVYIEFSELLEKLMRKGKGEVISDSLDPMIPAMALRGLLTSFFHQRLLMGNNIPLDQYADSLIDIFLHGVKQ